MNPSPTAPAAQPSIRAALEAPGCERLRDFYAVGPVQRAAVEAFASAIGGEPRTMQQEYGDGSDHPCCPKCGLCIECGDCASDGCGVRVDDAGYRKGYHRGYGHAVHGERAEHRVGFNPFENGYCDGYKDGRADRDGRLRLADELHELLSDDDLTDEKLRAASEGLLPRLHDWLRGTAGVRVDAPRGTFACPICGKDEPHHHDDEEVRQHREKDQPAAWIDNSGHPKHLSYTQGVKERELYGPLRPLYEAAAAGVTAVDGGPFCSTPTEERKK